MISLTNVVSTMAIAIGLTASPFVRAQKVPLPEKDRKLARAILQQLIESNTSHSAGSTTGAAEAMRRRLVDGGFFPSEVVVMGPDDRHGNLIARYRGNPASTKPPVLIICHLDVVEAKREDWTTDPFKLVEKDGYFYGRGTQDIKESDAASIVTFLRLKQEAYLPDRDIILALTAGEEGGEGNGVEWLLRTHRDLVDAAFALNADAGGVTTEKGKPVELGVEATEKLYADFELLATNAGGHSSVPVRDNALYHVADALGKIEAYTFPFEMNSVTRAYYNELAQTTTGEAADDMRSIAGLSPSPEAIARMSANPHYNSTMRTTCVATTMEAGHAPNALPQRAVANVNCRILPGHTPKEVRAELVKVIGDPQVEVALLNEVGTPSNAEENDLSPTPLELNPEVFHALRDTVDAMWPNLPIIPEMETGASDGKLTMAAGIPTYGFSGMGIDEDDDRAHGKDERIGVEAFYTGVEFDYLYLKRLTGGSLR
jgi:acetylornithine deacetylase/succinyl-diaminopimelate desuccinylase-like protein